MSIENLSEGKLPYNYKKLKRMKNLGIIPEENNNNSEYEKSNEYSTKIENKQNISFTNYSINIKNISFNKETDIDNNDSLFKYKTQKSFFDKKLFYDIMNEENIKNEESNNNISSSNEKHSKRKSEDIIILNSGKKQSELIKLISTNNSDKIGNENYTKNINLNININNNIQYEIEKNKEKEEESNDLNQSLNSLIKIAEKNCLYFSDTLQADNNKDKGKDIKESKDDGKLIKVKKNKSKINKENINLALYNNPIFKKVENNKIKAKKNEINHIQEEKINKSNNNIKTTNLIPKGNISNIKDKIYNKKKSIPKNISIKNYRNLSHKSKESEDIKKIYKRVKNNSKNVLSIGKKKDNSKEKKEEENIDNNINKNIIYEYQKSKKEKMNSLNHQGYNRNTFNDINSKKIQNNKIEMTKKFFEVNISLDNFNQKLHNFENSLDEGVNKIYKRPTVFINQTKKVKSLEKIKSEKDLFNNHSSRQKKKLKFKKNLQRAKTNINNNINENGIKQENTYIKKNLLNHANLSLNNDIKNDINNLNSPLYSYKNNNTNQNFYVNKKSRNEYKERNTINSYNISEYNLKKYEDIYNNSQTKIMFNNNSINLTIKLGDLLILEEKLCDIILALKKNKRAENQCLDFFISFYNFGIYKQIEKFFDNDVDEEIVRLFFNYKLITILLCYKFTKNNEISDISPFLEILQLCHRNLINVYEQIINRIANMNLNVNNIWIKKLDEIINYSKKSSEQMFQTENNIFSLIEKINFNTNSLIKKLKNILYYNKYQDKTIIVNFIQNLNQKTFEEIYYFFKEYIYIIDNPEGSILPQIYKPIHPEMQNQNYPYIKTMNKKRYTLILDLNETLISLKYTDNSKGLIRVRPYLYEFLDIIKQNFELIIFTGSTENYSKSIIGALERKKKYFDFIFCRQYLVKCGDCYLKDLSKIGRPLDSTIIIDNNPENYKLQKENGIYIKPFWGDNSDDNALYYLIYILNNIANEKLDVRDGLAKYKDDIVFKISASIV